VDEFAWELAFIAQDWRSWVEDGQSGAVAAQEARDGGLGEAAIAGDLKAGQVQLAQGEHDGDLGRRGLPRRNVWARRAITQTLSPFGAEASQPLAHGPLRDAGLRGDELGRELVVDNALDNCGSTSRGEPGILMDVHAVGDERIEVAHPQSLKSSPHEQPIETSQVGAPIIVRVGIIMVVAVRQNTAAGAGRLLVEFRVRRSDHGTRTHLGDVLRLL
jgi:hypothetical protein